MSDPKRRALAIRLFGTGVKGQPHGPLDPQWVVTHLAGTRQTLKRWRTTGIPQDRLEDVLSSIQELIPEIAKEAAPSLTRRLVAGVMALEAKAGVTPSELASAQDSAVALEAALEADARLAAELAQSQRKSGGRAAGQADARGAGSLGSTRRKPK